MITSLSNKYFIAYEHEHAIIKETIDAGKYFCNTSEDSIEQLTICISNKYDNLKIERSSSSVDIKHIEKMLNLLKSSIKPQDKIDQSIMFQYERKITYLESCYQFLNKLLPENCIIGIVDNIHQLYYDIDSTIKTLAQSDFSECIKKLINSISQINRTLNIIINFINTLQASRLKYLIFLKKVSILLEKLISGKFILNQKTKNENKEINLSKGELISIICDQNQEPILVFAVYNTDKNDRNPIDSFKKRLIECIRDFQNKTNLETFILKHYERRIQNPNFNNSIIYVDDYIKKQFTSFNNELVKTITYCLPNTNSLNNLISLISNKINGVKIINNEHLNIIDINEDSWKSLRKIGRFHFPQNKKILFNCYKLLLDQIPTEKSNDEKEIQNNHKKIDYIQGMLIELTKIYQNKGQNYFFEILFSKAIKQIINDDDLSKKMQEILGNTKKEKKIYTINQIENSQSDYSLCFDSDFYFLLLKKLPKNNNSADDINDDNTFSKGKNILSGNYSKFIVHSIDIKIDHITIPYLPRNSINSFIDIKNDHIAIPYFPCNSINSFIKNEYIKECSLTDKIIIILEIAIALKDLHEKNKYHGNLSDEFIFITSSKDAYISEFAFDSSSEYKSTIFQSPFYYRSPENFYKNDDNKNFYYISCDIYSFGVLMYEIITNTTPKNRMEEKSIQSAIDILKEKNDKNNEIINDNLIDHNGDSLVGIKDIIQKCLEIQPTKRYKSMQEIIDNIKELAIYENNKDEIEYRIEIAPDSSSYKCRFSDIVESFLIGNENSLEIIEKINDIICINLPSKEPKKIEKTNIIKSIFNIFDIKSFKTTTSILEYLLTLFIQNDDRILKKTCNIDNSTDYYWYTLLNKLKYYLPDKEYDINSILDPIFKFYIDKIGNDSQNEFYENFLLLFDTDNKQVDNDNDDIDEDKKSKNFLQKKFIDKIKECRKYGNYYIHLVFETVMKTILNQTLFTEKFHKILSSIHNYIELHLVKDALGFNEIDSSYKLFVDNDFNFVLQKTYNQNIKKEIRDREKNIMKENYSKFIISCEDDCQENKIIIPYFPCGNLDTLIRKQSQNSLLYTKRTIEFSYVDKIVIALEVGLALKDLHANNEFHGNLSSQFIFITSSMDAYIGGIAYDRKLEADSTKPRGPFYYRPPEITYFDCFNQIDENIKKQQLYDIYSYGVLIHELITEVSPERRMGNKSREERLHLLNGIYDQFLLNNDNNEFFLNDSFDTRGDNLSEFKQIIEKCLKKSVDERYQTFDEIIQEIKNFEVYKKNEHEIEFRIQNATSSSDYQCTISDIVEAFYLGNESSIKDIERSLSLYTKLSTCENVNNFEINGDILETIFNKFNVKYKIPDVEVAPLYETINEMIKVNFNQKINRINKVDDFNHQLFLISREANIIDQKNSAILDYIFPISSLDKFLNIIKINEWEDLTAIFSYSLAYELSYIHSQNLYHGDLSTKSIGIYFNTKTKTFVPSIILFYSFYKTNETSESNKKMKSNTDIEKLQNKDLSKLKSIINEFTNNKFEFISKCDSIDDLTFNLYNEIINSDTFEKNLELHHKYQLFDLTFTGLNDIMSQLISKNCKELIKDSLFIDFNVIINEIDCFIEEELKNLSLEIPKLKKPDFEPTNDTNNLMKKLEYINEKCYKLLLAQHIKNKDK